MVDQQFAKDEDSVCTLEKVSLINEEADKIQKACKARRSATHESLAALNGLLSDSDEFSEEKQKKQAVIANS